MKQFIGKILFIIGIVPFLLCVAYAAAFLHLYPLVGKDWTDR